MLLMRGVLGVRLDSCWIRVVPLTVLAVGGGRGGGSSAQWVREFVVAFFVSPRGVEKLNITVFQLICPYYSTTMSFFVDRSGVEKKVKLIVQNASGTQALTLRGLSNPQSVAHGSGLQGSCKQQNSH